MRLFFSIFLVVTFLAPISMAQDCDITIENKTELRAALTCINNKVGDLLNNLAAIENKLDTKLAETKSELQSKLDDKEKSIIANRERDIRNIAVLPIGTVIPSMLSPSQFEGQLKKPSIDDWVLADGRSVAGSKYAQIVSGNVPDLRGLFLRGMNFNGGSDPQNGRNVGGIQDDEFKKHIHSFKISRSKTQQINPCNDNVLVGQDKDTRCPLTITTSSEGDQNETRPKNVALYFYMKIN